MHARYYPQAAVIPPHAVSMGGQSEIPQEPAWYMLVGTCSLLAPLRHNVQGLHVHASGVTGLPSTCQLASCVLRRALSPGKPSSAQESPLGLR